MSDEPDRPTTTPLEVVVLAGLQASGKTSFVRERLAGTHLPVSKDRFRHNRNRERRQEHLLEEALAAGRSVVVDNTNPAPADRAGAVAAARRHGARVVAVLLLSTLDESLRRNAERPGRERVPDVGVRSTARRLAPPEANEGFDAVLHAWLAGERFAIALMAGGPAPAWATTPPPVGHARTEAVLPIVRSPASVPPPSLPEGA